MAPFDIKGLTVGERLIISRRRSAESQEATAKNYGITRNAYGRIERDTEDLPPGFSPPEIDSLEDHEKCFLLRRRAGVTQEDCADAVGVTRFWFNQMETGKDPCASLVEFWEKHDER